MVVTIEAVLLSASQPRPVQVRLNGVAAGESYVITKTTADGARKGVSGGVGVSDGTQVLLTDNRTPLNVPVTYEALVGGVTYAAAPVTVESDRDAVVQSLDGLAVVAVDIASVTEPRSAQSRSSVFDIAGRSDPAARLDVPGSFAYSWELEAEGADAAALRAILASSPIIVRRITPGMRDLDAVVIALVTAWKDELVTEGLSTWRRFSLTLRELGDPQPSARLVAFTWEDFDAAMSSRTWDDFDALFETWDQFDAADWSLL